MENVIRKIFRKASKACPTIYEKSMMIKNNLLFPLLLGKEVTICWQITIKKSPSLQ
jgi:hypothetical protein